MALLRQIGFRKHILHAKKDVSVISKTGYINVIIAVLVFATAACTLVEPAKTPTDNTLTTCDTVCQDEKRRRAYLTQHPNLSVELKNAILEGRVLIGMTKDQVVAALGRPDQRQDSSTWAAREQWIYNAGTDQARFFTFQFGKINRWW